MKTLFVSDLDGTLLRPDGRVSEFSAQTVNALIKRGVVFSYATARSIHSAGIVTAGLDLEAPVVVYNGAFIIDVKTGKTISKTIFLPEDTAALSNFLTRAGIFPLVYSFVLGRERVSWLEGSETPGMLYYLKMRKNDSRLRRVRDTASLYEGDVFYVTCIGERDELLPVYNHFATQNNFSFFLQKELYRPEYWCEFTRKEATKANGILKLKELLGCGRVVSFGDGLNDVPMFEVSDECYATANAAPELKEKATAVIGGNENDGVAVWLLENAGAGS